MSNKLEEARRIINEVDAQMAELFVKRMRAAELVCEHKMKFGLPILDQKREDAVIERNSALVEDEVLKGYYIDYLKNLGITLLPQAGVALGMSDLAKDFGVKNNTIIDLLKSFKRVTTNIKSSMKCHRKSSRLSH